MKILVIGAAGFIGNACFNYFSVNNETVGVDRFGTPSKNLIIDHDFTAIPILIAGKFDVIINCAGSSSIQGSFIHTGDDFLSNVVFLKQILELIRTSSPGTKIINLSSAAVYGNPETLPVSEDTPANPLSPYGLHKLLSEKLMEEYALYFKLNTLSVRIFSAYGPGLKRQFFYDLYSKFNSGTGTVNLNGTGNESRDFIYITDITKAFEVLIQKGKFDGSVYNLASQRESFILPTSQLFAAICNYTGEIKFNQKQFEGYPLNWKADISKINSLGYSPKIILEDGLKLYFNWIKDN